MRSNNLFRKLSLRLLSEAEEEEKEEYGVDSLDEQIDKYFTSYEKEAKLSKNEGLDFRMMTKRFLFEADDDEEDEEKKSKEDEEEEEPEDEEETEEDEESEESDEEEEEDEEEEKLTIEDIDVSAFTNDVIRLIENYDSLLEVRNTILRRASNFMAKNYEQDVVDKFKEELSTVHGVEIGKSESETMDKFQAPRAGSAGPSGGGGG